MYKPKLQGPSPKEISLMPEIDQASIEIPPFEMPSFDTASLSDPLVSPGPVFEPRSSSRATHILFVLIGIIIFFLFLGSILLGSSDNPSNGDPMPTRIAGIIFIVLPTIMMMAIGYIYFFGKR